MIFNSYARIVYECMQNSKMIDRTDSLMWGMDVDIGPYTPRKINQTKINYVTI